MNPLTRLALTIGIAAALIIPTVRAQGAPERTKVVHAAAYALGMTRWSDIGTTTTRLPAIDIVNTMEFEANGTLDVSGQPVKVAYHAALGYNPPAMRVEITRAGATPQHTIHTVRDGYAWDESEIGAGLVDGKGTATPAAAALNERLLQLWTLPYGVVKAALAAGDKAAVSVEGGATVITVPLTGTLAGVTMKATLDANSLITRVETRSASPSGAALTTQSEYFNYADRAEILTDIKTPGRIVRKQGTRTILDIEVKTWETNNPYLVFPVPRVVQLGLKLRN